MWGPATITLSVAALFLTAFVQTEGKLCCLVLCEWSLNDSVLFSAASGKDPVSIEASSRLVSALCGLSDVYKESQTMPNVSLKSPPPGVTLLAAPCDTFVRKCSNGRKSVISEPMLKLYNFLLYLCFFSCRMHGMECGKGLKVLQSQRHEGHRWPGCLRE